MSLAMFQSGLRTALETSKTIRWGSESRERSWAPTITRILNYFQLIFNVYVSFAYGQDCSTNKAGLDEICLTQKSFTSRNFVKIMTQFRPIENRVALAAGLGDVMEKLGQLSNIILFTSQTVSILTDVSQTSVRRIKYTPSFRKQILEKHPSLFATLCWNKSLWWAKRIQMTWSTNWSCLFLTTLD